MRMRIWLLWLAFPCLAALTFAAPPGATAGSRPGTAMFAGHFRVPIPNAYCDIPTFVLPHVIGDARAIVQFDGKPAIFVDAEAASKPGYLQFLLAHECCHHTRGHLARLIQERRHGRTQSMGFFTSAQALREMELEADCCAAVMLKKRNSLAGLDAALAAMKARGGQQFDEIHPPGEERATRLMQCAKVR